MNKRQKPGREQVVPVQEKDLKIATGADGQHVDNPGQAPMKDGPS